MDERPHIWIGWTAAYIAFVVALTVFATWGWPRLGPWVWAHF